MKILLLLLLLFLFLGKTGAHLTTIIWEEKERHCVDLIDSIIFSRSTCRWSKTTLVRCMHTQEKHYRWHTHTHSCRLVYKQKKRHREVWIVHITRTDRKVKNQSCLQDVCTALCIRLFYICVGMCVCIIILKHASFPSSTTL